MGDILHLKLNIGKEPIADKYREGKMKRTLKRELKVSEIAKGEALVNYAVWVRRMRYKGLSCSAAKAVVESEVSFSL
jgi:hypothetical protein